MVKFFDFRFGEKKGIGVNMIKKILSYGIIMAILLGLLISPADAASSNKVFYGYSLDSQRNWWINSLNNDRILNQIIYNNGYVGYEASEVADANYALNVLKERAGIFAVHTHGNVRNVFFKDGIAISEDDINALDTGALNHVDMVVYGTCQAAKGADNIANSTFEKGAKVVIGFRDITYVNQVNQWMYDFFKSYSNGNSVTTAAADGLYWAKFWNFGDPGGTESVRIYE